MITILLALINFFRRPNKYWSIEEIWTYYAKRYRENTMAFVDICFKVYICEESLGIPHMHTLGNISKITGMPPEEVQERYTKYIMGCTYLSL
jgi:hypothetical protein